MRQVSSHWPGAPSRALQLAGLLLGLTTSLRGAHTWPDGQDSLGGVGCPLGTSEGGMQSPRAVPDDAQHGANTTGGSDGASPGAVEHAPVA
jgi:hypothetical protein